MRPPADRLPHHTAGASLTIRVALTQAVQVQLQHLPCVCRCAPTSAATQQPRPPVRPAAARQCPRAARQPARHAPAKAKLLPASPSRTFKGFKQATVASPLPPKAHRGPQLVAQTPKCDDGRGRHTAADTLAHTNAALCSQLRALRRTSAQRSRLHRPRPPRQRQRQSRRPRTCRHPPGSASARARAHGLSVAPPVRRVKVAIPAAAVHVTRRGRPVVMIAPTSIVAARASVVAPPAARHSQQRNHGRPTHQHHASRWVRHLGGGGAACLATRRPPASNRGQCCASARPPKPPAYLATPVQ